MSTTKKIAKNFSWLMVGEVMSRMINFALIIYLARILGTSAFGSINFAEAILAYLLIVVDFGLSVFGTREIAKNRERAGGLYFNIILLRLSIALIVFAFSVVFVYLLPINLNLKILFWLTFLFVFYRAIDPEWVFQGMEKMHLVGISKLLISIGKLILIFVFVKSSADILKVPLFNFLAGFLIAGLFLCGLYYLFVKRKSKMIILESWKTYLIEAFPLGASAVLVQIYYNMDSIMLGIMQGAAPVGLYNAAYKLFSAVLFSLGLWQFSVFPEASKRFSQDKTRAKEFLTKYLHLTLLFAVPGCFIAMLTAPFLMRLFYGTQYLAAVPALQILVWNLIAIAISGLYGTLVLVPMGKTKSVLYGVGCGAVVNIILNFLFIPAYGYVGAAYATLIAEIVVAVVLYLLARQQIDIGLLNLLVKPLLASLPAIGLAYLSMYLFFYDNCIAAGLLAGTIFALLYFISIILLGEGKFIVTFIKEITTKRTGEVR